LQEAEATELSDRLRIALTLLPANQGQAFCLRHLNGLEYEEIAVEMELSVDAAGALLHRARTHLKELLLDASTVDLKRR
jgi:RNA polymerase sigma-70 factor, ECF subfamily